MPIFPHHEVLQGIWTKLIAYRPKLALAAIAIITLSIGGLMKASGTPRFWTITDAPRFCTSCHNMRPYYASWHDSSLLANQHARANVRCHDCHKASLLEQVSEGAKYVTGAYQTPLKKRAFPNEFCTRCHNFAKVKARSDANPEIRLAHNSHILGTLICTDCHSMHRQSKVMCSQCHSTQWKSLPASWDQSYQQH